MDSKGVSSSIARFAAKFCNQLNKESSVVSSPLSAEYLLALVALGSTDPAHSELLTALDIPDNDSIRSAFASVSSKLHAIKGVTLNVANRIYVNQGPYELEPRLLEDATKVFDAGIEKLDFSRSAAAANLINTWVENKTNSRIKDLFSADAFDNDTRLVLVNALYFKGTWKSQFKPHQTRPQDFYVNTNTTIQVPMMHIEETFKYGESDALGAQFLQMQYEGEEASMVIILPREIEGLGAIMQTLADGFDLMSELNKMFSTKVQVSLPKFKIETEIDLNILLPKIGIESIFSKSNSGLDNLLQPPQPLFVSKAIQKAFIEVNEEGAEAAAATAGAVRKRRCALRPEEFKMDRPSLLLVLAERQVLLAGCFRPAGPSAPPPPHDEL